MVMLDIFYSKYYVLSYRVTMLECVSICSLVQQYTAQGICGNLVMSQCQNVSSALKCSLSFQNASLTINLEIKNKKNSTVFDNC